VETLSELINQSLEQGEDVLITGFGKIYVQKKKGRGDATLKAASPWWSLPEEWSLSSVQAF
jgi:nucleoid DNA-binding protein